MIELGSGSRAWRDAAYAVLDFEATGLDFDRDHVLSYGVVPVAGGRVRLGESTYRVVRPPIAVPAESIRVHGIRPVELEEAPPLEDVVDDLASALRGRILVAHAAGIELGFLRHLRQRYGLPRARGSIDVLDLAAALAALDPDAPRPGARRLSAIAESFGVPVTRTHHAFADALTTAQVFLVLASRLERVGAGRVRDLTRARRPQFA